MLAVDYNPNTSVVLFVFEPDRRCEILMALEYVQLIAGNTVERVVVLEGDYMAYDMKRRDRRSQWVNIARQDDDGL